MKTVFNIKIDFKKSQGAFLYDKLTNAQYFDMFSMFSSLPLGYNHPVFDSAFDDEVKYISHLKMSNNLFLSEEFVEFEETFSEIGFHKNLHFCSTGALAVESAIKCAFEYSKKPNSIVVSAKNSFHGINSWGFATDREIDSVKPRMEYYPENNWLAIESRSIPEYITKNHNNISAVIIEPVQCTAGDVYIPLEALLAIEAKCRLYDVCLIVDEIQTGFGVTGEMWYSDKIGLDPDIIVFGKKSQISGIMANDKYAGAINSQFRKLQVTFDGDLIDAVRSRYIIDAIRKYSLLDNVLIKSRLIRNEIGGYFQNYRSSGFLIAFDFDDRFHRDEFVADAFQKKLLVNPTGEKTVRIRPNMAFSDEDCQVFFNKLEEVLF